MRCNIYQKKRFLRRMSLRRMSHKKRPPNPAHPLPLPKTVCGAAFGGLSLSLSFSLVISSGGRMKFLHRRHFVPSRFVVLSSRIMTVLSKQQQALAYLSRHPPTCTGLKPQP